MPVFLEARDGLIDLAPASASYETLAPRIEAAKIAIEKLITLCGRGNREHAALAEYGEECRAELDRVKPPEPGIRWYVIAQQIEGYRSHYLAMSKQQPGDYPPLEPALSTAIDTVVLTTGILALQFPEIAKSQDDFEKYEGRQLGVRRAQRELLDDALSALATSNGVLTPEAAAVANRISGLDPGATPEDAPETARIVATKNGLMRAFLVAIAKRAVEKAGKKIGDALVEAGYSSALAFLISVKPNLLALAAQWPAMYGFVEPLFRLIG
jgi:hypothetical protein